jgi:hypothetical protein
MSSEQVAFGAAIGVGIGSVLGVVLDDMGVGVAGGMGIDMALAIGWNSFRKGR